MKRRLELDNYASKTIMNPWRRLFSILGLSVIIIENLTRPKRSGINILLFKIFSQSHCDVNIFSELFSEGGAYFPGGS